MPNHKKLNIMILHTLAWSRANRSENFTKPCIIMEHYKSCNAVSYNSVGVLLGRYHTSWCKKKGDISISCKYYSTSKSIFNV